MHPSQSIFPILPPGSASAFSQEPIRIDGLEVEVDERVELMPARLEVIHDGESRQLRPVSRPGSQPARNRARNA